MIGDLPISRFRPQTIFGEKAGDGPGRMAKAEQHSLRAKHQNFEKKWCPRADSNHRHSDFQSLALPTELLGHLGLRDALATLGSDAIGGAIAACPA